MQLTQCLRFAGNDSGLQIAFSLIAEHVLAAERLLGQPSQLPENDNVNLTASSMGVCSVIPTRVEVVWSQNQISLSSSNVQQRRLHLEQPLLVLADNTLIACAYSGAAPLLCLHLPGGVPRLAQALAKPAGLTVQSVAWAQGKVCPITTCSFVTSQICSALTCCGQHRTAPCCTYHTAMVCNSDICRLTAQGVRAHHASTRNRWFCNVASGQRCQKRQIH